MVTDPAGVPGVAPVATILICTFNRCQLLDETLASLEHLIAPAVSWDILVVDNNSTDATADVVRKRQTSSPVPLQYLHEARQGKSHALNSGLASTRAAHIVFTDDDVRVEPGWLAAGLAPMLEDEAIAYTGGPVLPIWGAPRPKWLDARRGDLWGTIAILDYGPDAFVFEERQRIPLGANMAVRRTVIEAAGGFDPALGRTGGSLLGQEQAEFFCRTRALGARGVYVPGMVLHHHVPASRLTRRYFRRWWLWKGISRARLYRVHPQAEPGIDLMTARRIGNVPGFVLSGVARHAAQWLASGLRGQLIPAVRHEMMFAYYLGFAWEEWRRRGSRRS